MPEARNLHSKDTEAGRFDRSVRGGGEAKSQNHPGIHRVYDTVVPEPGGRVVRVPFLLVLLEDGPLELLALLVRHLSALALEVVLLHGQEDVRGLCSAHDADAGVRPHPQEARRVGAAAHTVVAGSEGAANDHGELRDAGVRDSHDHLGAVLGNAARLVRFTDHEAGYVLQEDERDATRSAQLDKVRPLERALGEQDAVVCEYADRHPHDAGEAAHQRLAVERLELVQPAPVHDPGDDLPYIVALAVVPRHDAVEVFCVVERFLGLLHGPRGALLRVQVLHDRAYYGEGVLVVLGEVVGYPRAAGMDVCAPELLGGHFFAGRGLDERWTAEEYRTRTLHDHDLVAHRRHVGPAGRAAPHDGGYLRNSLRAHPRLVVEDAPEVVPIREHLVLQRQERSPRIYQVDTRKTVLLGDLLCAKVLLDRYRIIRATLYRRIVGDDHDISPRDASDAGDDACRRHPPVVHPERR